VVVVFFFFFGLYFFIVVYEVTLVSSLFNQHFEFLNNFSNKKY
jgi:hypothetical protein